MRPTHLQWNQQEQTSHSSMQPEFSDKGQTQWTLKDALEGEVDEEVAAEFFLPGPRKSLVPPRAAMVGLYLVI